MSGSRTIRRENNGITAALLTNSYDGKHRDGIPDCVSAEHRQGVSLLEAILLDQRS